MLNCRKSWNRLALSTNFKKNGEAVQLNRKRDWRKGISDEIAAQEKLSVVLACTTVGLPRSTYYRTKVVSSNTKTQSQRRSHPRALSADERQEVLELMLSDRFINESPSAIYATLLDEDRRLCSVSTMYRLLKAAAEVCERRQASRNIKRAKPELYANSPNQVWSWDITKLAKSDNKWSYYYFYAIIDIFSRMIVGWTVEERESAKSAESLISKTCSQQSIEPDQLVIHSDRGSPMKSKLVSQLLVDLGVLKSLSRPHVSNDNPFSEASFKTLRSRPEFPNSFDSIEHAESFLERFVYWNNYKHKHGGIAFMTPATVHHGKAADCLKSRQSVLNKAYDAHPERFVRGAPNVSRLPSAVGINLPRTIEGLAASFGGTVIGGIQEECVLCR